MGLWDKLRGELIDIIEWTEPSQSDILCYRFPRYNNEIKMGAKLTVREGQAAVFVNEGRIADVFQPGMHTLQAEINDRWAADGLPAFGLGIGLSTGEAAAALLGSEERLEYTLVGDTVNMSQRLQQLAAAGETVLSEATTKAMTMPVSMIALPPQLVKGRDTAIAAYKITKLDIPAPATPQGLPITP